jgi:hypothetical protein
MRSIGRAGVCGFCRMRGAFGLPHPTSLRSATLP